MSIQKSPSGKYRAVVRRAGEKRNGTARATRREAIADEAQIRLEMGAPAAEAEVTVDALLKDQIEQGRYAATTLEDLRRVHRTLPAPKLRATAAFLERRLRARIRRNNRTKT